MLKHIIVPLDGSALAETALAHAQEVVCSAGKLTLLMVVPATDIPIYDFYPVPTTVIRDYEASLHEAVPFARDYLERVAAPLRANPNLEVETRVEIGDPASVIVEFAKKLHVDAVVMSTHGRSGLRSWLFGSVTQKVLASAACPILVVPNFKRTERHEPDKVETSA